MFKTSSQESRVALIAQDLPSVVLNATEEDFRSTHVWHLVPSSEA